MRLPPPAMRWPASSGMSATSLCIRCRITALTWLRSAETSWIIGSRDGGAGRSEWIVALMSRRLCAVAMRKARPAGRTDLPLREKSSGEEAEAGRLVERGADDGERRVD